MARKNFTCNNKLAIRMFLFRFEPTSQKRRDEIALLMYQQLKPYRKKKLYGGKFGNGESPELWEIYNKVNPGTNRPSEKDLMKACIPKHHGLQRIAYRGPQD